MIHDDFEEFKRTGDHHKFETLRAACMVGVMSSWILLAAKYKIDGM